MSVKVPELGEAQNISADGMCVLVKNPLAIGNLLELEFRPVPEASLIKCKGEVMWRREMADGRVQIGLKFVWTNPTDGP